MLLQAFASDSSFLHPASVRETKGTTAKTKLLERLYPIMNLNTQLTPENKYEKG
jgi:hypothetical protein